MGRVSGQPHWQTTKTQRYLCFTLITEERIKKGRDYQVHEESHTISMPEAYAPTEILNNGDVLYVQGRLQTRSFLDEKTVRHYRTEIVASNIDIVTPALAVTPIQ